MGKWIKRFVLLMVLVVVLTGGFALYVGVVAGLNVPVLSSAFRAEPAPPSPETIARARAVETRIEEEVSENTAFFLQLSDEDLTALIQARAGESASVVRDLKVEISEEQVGVSGALNGRVGIPFSGSVGVELVRGIVQLEVLDLSVAFAGLPGAVEEELQPLIDEVLDVNEMLSSALNVQIQQVLMSDGEITIVGVQSGGKLVSDVTVESLIDAYQGESTIPVAPGADIVPPGRTGGAPGDPLYLALGDSLAANVSASSAQAGYVSRFHGFMERELGMELGLTNLGVSGESSSSIFASQLPQALEILDQMKNDGDPDTRVAVLTIDLGPNDVLGHLGSAACQQDIRGEACTARIDAGINTFDENFGEILDALAAGLEPGAEFYVVQPYNPFDFGIGIPFEADSNDVMERLNDIVEREGTRVGATVADAYTIMAGKAGAWTHMLSGDIHPTDDGYQAMAYALATSRE